MWWVSTANGEQQQQKKSTAVGGARAAEKKKEWRAPNKLLVVQTGDSACQAKVFKEHAAPLPTNLQRN